jgi:hypothetical protein
MKPPSAEYLHWLQQNMDKIPPMDQPVIVPPDGAAPGHPHADGPVGYIQPNDPSGSAKPSAPLPPDPGQPAATHGLTAPQGAVQQAEHIQSGVYSPQEDAAQYGDHRDGGQYSGGDGPDGFSRERGSEPPPAWGAEPPPAWGSEEPPDSNPTPPSGS